MAYVQMLIHGQPTRIDLTTDRVIIGRGTGCHVMLSGQTVSRHHSEIVRHGESFVIGDLESRNGTWINGTKIQRPSTLADRDVIRIAGYDLTFHVAPPVATEAMQLIVTEEQQDREHILSSLDTPSTEYSGALVRPEVKLRVILEMSQKLRSSLSMEEVLPKILEMLFQILPQADHGSILLKGAESDRLIPKAVRNQRRQADESLRISRTLINRVFENGQAILLGDTLDDVPLVSSSVQKLQMRSILCAPLLDQRQKPMGIIQVFTENRQHPFTQEDLDLLVSVAGTASIAVENARLHEELMEQERLKREVQIAKEVQQGFLPASLPEVPGYSFYAHYEAAHQVGGDYYGFMDLPNNRLAITVGDVSGKGIPAALLMAHLASDIRSAALVAADPAAALRLVRDSLSEAALGDKFITLLFMVLDKAQHTLSIANAGHWPPLLRSQDGTVEAIGEAETGLPLTCDVKADYEYRSLTIELGPGSLVLAYTDGVTEAMNHADEMFKRKRLEAILKDAPSDPRRAGESVIDELRRFTTDRSQSDDITLLCIGAVPDSN